MSFKLFENGRVSSSKHTFVKGIFFDGVRKLYFCSPEKGGGPKVDWTLDQKESIKSALFIGYVIMQVRFHFGNHGFYHRILGVEEKSVSALKIVHVNGTWYL